MRALAYVYGLGSVGFAAEMVHMAVRGYYVIAAICAFCAVGYWLAARREWEEGVKP